MNKKANRHTYRQTDIVHTWTNTGSKHPVFEMATDTELKSSFASDSDT
jgi:hypothetical protein